MQVFSQQVVCFTRGSAGHHQTNKISLEAQTVQSFNRSQPAAPYIEGIFFPHPDNSPTKIWNIYLHF